MSAPAPEPGLDRMWAEATEALEAGANEVSARLHRQLAAVTPTVHEVIYRLGALNRRLSDYATAQRLIRRAMTIRGDAPARVRRSTVIPILDLSPHSPFNIETLLGDLARFDGEVICVFNNKVLADRLAGHPRINRYAVNSDNVGVGRAWNIGLNLAEGEIVFMLNADLHVSQETLEALESGARLLPDAVAVGVGGDLIDWERMVSVAVIDQSAQLPRRGDIVSGFLFALHAERFHAAGLSFDPRLGPFFYEEMDLGLKAAAAGLNMYAVAAAGWRHDLGISANPKPVRYLGREVDRVFVMARNAEIAVARRRLLAIGSRKQE
jgi:hypothetical protein